MKKASKHLHPQISYIPPIMRYVHTHSTSYLHLQNTHPKQRKREGGRGGGRRSRCFQCELTNQRYTELCPLCTLPLGVCTTREAWHTRSRTHAHTHTHTYSVHSACKSAQPAGAQFTESMCYSWWKQVATVVAAASKQACAVLKWPRYCYLSPSLSLHPSASSHTPVTC